MQSADDEFRIRGPWTKGEMAAFLQSTTAPMRLAVNGSSGFPVLTPLWHLWSDGSIWAAARPNSAMVRNLRRDPRCAFEVSIETPPYKGVRGRGHATIEPNGLEVLQRLLDRFMGSDSPAFQERLLQGSQDEAAIRIRPTELISWDFSKRMAN